MRIENRALESRVVLDITEATAEWLAGVLWAKGCLLTGTVEAVQRIGEASVHAHTARLAITYSADASGTLPATLFLKVCKEGRNFTCIHGDPNPGNILTPLQPEGRAYLADRQPFPWSLTTWTGASDLAYMMVQWWETGVRRKLEELLRRYLQALQARHVEDYPWEKLWACWRINLNAFRFLVKKRSTTRADSSMGGGNGICATRIDEDTLALQLLAGIDALAWIR